MGRTSLGNHYAEVRPSSYHLRIRPGVSLTVLTPSFNLGETYRGSGQCVGALSGKDLGLGSNVWLLGDR